MIVGTGDGLARSPKCFVGKTGKHLFKLLNSFINGKAFLRIIQFLGKLNVSIINKITNIIGYQ